MSVRIKVIVAISLTLFLVFAIFALYLVGQYRHSAEAGETERLELLVLALQSEIDKRYYLAYTAVHAVAGDEQAQQLLAAGDRDTLYLLMQPLYRDIERQIAQFHFHLPDSTSFLRMHSPGQYGDYLGEDRYLVRMANATRRTYAGIEEGQGGIGYRVITPIFYNGDHVGAVEMGADLGQPFLEALKYNYGSEYILYSIKDRNNFYAATVSEDKFSLTEAQLQIVANGETHFYRSDDQLNSLIILPLQDFRGDTVAYLKVLSDRQPLLNRLEARQSDLLILFLLAILITAAIIHFLVRQTVLVPLDRIKKFLRKISQLDFNERLPVKGNDELTEIAVNLNQTVEVISSSMTELKVTHEQMLQILDGINALVYVIDLDSFEILFINRYGRDLYGDVVGSKCWQVLQKGQSSPCDFCRRDFLVSGEQVPERQYVWEQKSTYDGRHYDYRVTLMQWFDGRSAKLAVATDVSARKLAEEIILQSREWYRTLAEDIPALVCRFGPTGNLTYVNNAYCRFYGIKREELLGLSFMKFVPPEHHHKVRKLIKSLSQERAIASHEQTNYAFDGSLRWVSWTNRAIFGSDGELKEYLSVGEDITERKNYEEQLIFLGLHDSLTGLYNKTYCDSEIERLEGGREYPVTLIVGDLDNLKKINDCYGHSVGDRVLKICADILKKSVRQGDVLARVGGDEFIIIMPRADFNTGEMVIERIKEELKKYNQDNPEPWINISLGLAESAGPSVNLSETFIAADKMMYRSKSR